jgi:hypothetical protein
MAITAYIITTDWRYQEHLIGFEHVSGAHDGENLADITFKVIQDFNITDRLFAITADNASNNQTLRKGLAKRLQRKSHVIWDASTHTVPCLAHVVQLVVKEMVHSLKIDTPHDKPTMTWDRIDPSLVDRTPNLSTAIHKVCVIAW